MVKKLYKIYKIEYEDAETREPHSAAFTRERDARTFAERLEFFGHVLIYFSSNGRFKLRN
jgi:hypothetical protein